MPGECTRRTFLQVAATAATGALVSKSAGGQEPARGARGAGGPVAIASGNGLAVVARAGEMMTAGADPLDAAVAGVAIVEADPEDNSVGYGGLPNEEGVVELDASVMHGPTHRAGAVASLRNIMHPAQVAKLVMERTDHVLLVGEGAHKFARAHGFPEVNLLTEKSRQAWLRWKESLSPHDDWISPEEEDGRQGAAGAVPFTYGTVHCSALAADGSLAGVTSTSGLAWKLPGRVGDSPIIGAGLFVDNNIGSAGATGRGESVILSAGAATIVELMGTGLEPTEACRRVLQRIADRTHSRRLRGPDGRVNFDVKLYAVRKDGRYGGAAIHGGSPGPQMAVFTAGRARLEPMATLY
jgi:N4-(beta-N-acetylglucosaminyl)-L-asparaginase